MSAPCVAARDGVLHPMMTTTTSAVVFPLRGCLQVHNLLRPQTIVCRRPQLSACHQVFSRALPRMPTARLLASTQSTARCVFVLTTVSRVSEDDSDWSDAWRTLLSCSASRHATLASHLHADRKPAPEFLEQSYRRFSWSWSSF